MDVHPPKNGMKIGIHPYPYQFKVQIIWHMFLRDDHSPFSEPTTAGVVNRLTNCLFHDVYVHKKNRNHGTRAAAERGTNSMLGKSL